MRADQLNTPNVHSEGRNAQSVYLAWGHELLKCITALLISDLTEETFIIIIINDNYLCFSWDQCHFINFKSINLIIIIIIMWKLIQKYHAISSTYYKNMFYTCLNFDLLIPELSSLLQSQRLQETFASKFLLPHLDITQINYRPKLTGQIKNVQL
jgi:hypothetical protein